jgi:hypothetical protein
MCFSFPRSAINNKHRKNVAGQHRFGADRLVHKYPSRATRITVTGLQVTCLVICATADQITRDNINKNKVHGRLEKCSHACVCVKENMGTKIRAYTGQYKEKL